jgi:hypothetical protein
VKEPAVSLRVSSHGTLEDLLSNNTLDFRYSLTVGVDCGGRLLLGH